VQALSTLPQQKSQNHFLMTWEYKVINKNHFQDKSYEKSCGHV